MLALDIPLTSEQIRCDASTEGGAVETCTNCRRISQTCQFSRVPMKRGPSKGFVTLLRVENGRADIRAGTSKN